MIQEELLKDFESNSDLSNWFGREDEAPPAVVVKKPHPKNVQNTEKIKELEEQIQKYVGIFRNPGGADANADPTQITKRKAFAECTSSATFNSPCQTANTQRVR